jgi:hypothetical protein
LSFGAVFVGVVLLVVVVKQFSSATICWGAVMLAIGIYSAYIASVAYEFTPEV